MTDGWKEAGVWGAVTGVGAGISHFSWGILAVVAEAIFRVHVLAVLVAGPVGLVGLPE